MTYSGLRVLQACALITFIAAAVSHITGVDDKIEAMLSDPLVEVEERHQLSTSAEQVCTADGRQVSSFVCTLEEAETDQVIFRGGAGVTSADGLQYCDTCNMGSVISGDSRSSYLVATSGTPQVRCVCGYR